jgi:hypothetical protein
MVGIQGTNKLEGDKETLEQTGQEQLSSTQITNNTGIARVESNPELFELTPEELLARLEATTAQQMGDRSAKQNSQTIQENNVGDLVAEQIDKLTDLQAAKATTERLQEIDKETEETVGYSPIIGSQGGSGGKGRIINRLKGDGGQDQENELEGGDSSAQSGLDQNTGTLDEGQGKSAELMQSAELAQQLDSFEREWINLVVNAAQRSESRADLIALLLIVKIAHKSMLDMLKARRKNLKRKLKPGELPPSILKTLEKIESDDDLMALFEMAGIEIEGYPLPEAN